MKNFNTQVCTTIEQSKRLIDLGVNPDTADMGWFKAYSLKEEIYKPFIKGYKLENNKTDIPAWSLDRLIEMLKDDNTIEFSVGINRYDEIIATIQSLIHIEQFNKEYLLK